MRNALSSEAICTSAAIACLYLARGHFGFGVSELYYLVDTILTHGDSNHESPFADIPECEMIYPVRKARLVADIIHSVPIPSFCQSHLPT